MDIGPSPDGIRPIVPGEDQCFEHFVQGGCSLAELRLAKTVPFHAPRYLAERESRGPGGSLSCRYRVIIVRR